jgi:hypothetical protein
VALTTNASKMPNPKLRSPLFIFISLIVFALAWLAVGSVMRGKALSQDMAALRNMGVPLTRKEALASLPSDGENAASKYEAAFEAYAGSDIDHDDEASITMFLAGSEQNYQRARQYAHLLGRDHQAATKRAIAKGAEAIRVMDEGAQMPRLVFREGTEAAGVSDSEGQRMYNLSLLCEARTKLSVKTGDKPAALRSLRTLAMISTHMAGASSPWGAAWSNDLAERAVEMVRQWPSDKALLREVLDVLNKQPAARSPQQQLLLQPLRSRDALLGDPNRRRIAHQSASSDSVLPNQAVGWLMGSNWVRREAESKLMSYWRRVFERLPKEDPSGGNSSKVLMKLNDELREDSSLSGHLVRTVVNRVTVDVDRGYWERKRAIAEIELKLKDPKAKLDPKAMPMPVRPVFPVDTPP